MPCRGFYLPSDAPRQQFVYAVDRVISDIGQNMGQVSTRVDTIEFAAPDERVHRCSPLAPAIGTDEHKIFSSEADAAQRVFREIIVYLDRAVIAVQDQRGPLIQRVVDRLGRLRLGRQCFELGPKPGFVGIEQRPGLFLSRAQPLVRRLAAYAGFDGVESADIFERFFRRIRRCAHVNIVEFSPRVSMTGRLSNRAVDEQLIEATTM